MLYMKKQERVANPIVWTMGYNNVNQMFISSHIYQNGPSFV